LTAIDREARVYVAGHTGLVGRAITRLLLARGFQNLLTRTRGELDLTNATSVEGFFKEERPEYVFVAAAKVGGIMANREFPGDFIRENLSIQLNLLDAARRHQVEKLLFLGSSCIYPKHASQPIAEDCLLTGPLEPTNRSYAIAKIAGIEMCQAYWRQYGCRFISAMPTNLYGPWDNFDLDTSHVLPALIRKFHEAKVSGAPEASVWGSGAPRREFLHVDDLAAACLFLMSEWQHPDVVNVGSGQDISIGDLAATVREVVGFEGEIVFDRSKPDGTPRKLMDVSRLTDMGWTAQISLVDGIRTTYDWFQKAGT
jgi:GDP-L-fucose synthase